MKHYMKSKGAVGALGLLFAVTAGHVAQARSRMPQDPIIGLWYTEGNRGGVETFYCNDTQNTICARLYWLGDKKTAQPDDNDLDEGIDKHNPDPDKKNRPLCKMQFIGDVMPDGDGHYNGGWVYDARSGSVYNVELELAPDHETLDISGSLQGNAIISTVTGFIARHVVGGETWKRAKEMPACTLG